MDSQDEKKLDGSTPAAAAVRWRLLSRALIPSRRGNAESELDGKLQKVSRRPEGRYNLVPCRILTLAESRASERDSMDMEARIHKRPNRVGNTCRQRQHIELQDFALSQQNAIDTTGIVCLWPAEEVLTYFCAIHPDIFRCKTVIELGAGYGLGGLAIAACTEATEVVITDGSSQVVDYIEQNIKENLSKFGSTKVSASALYWNREQIPLCGRTFDLVVAADCTFFKEFHVDLAHTIKCLLGTSNESQAILFNPRRGDTLNRFIHAAESLELKVEMIEQYDAQVWNIHHELLKDDLKRWPNYDSNHCYPLYLSVTRRS